MSLPYMPLYVEDYLADAEHLPTIGHGAYLLLIMNYWRRQAPLPADDFVLQGIARLSDSDWQRLKPHIARFFTERDGFWHHKRVDEELDRAKAKLEQVRNAGKASAERKSNARSTPVERPLESVETDVRKAKAEGKVETALLCSNEQSSSSPPPPPVLDEKEIERRLEQATGWRDLRNIQTVSKLVRGGMDFDGRILPLARTVAAEQRDMGKESPASWGYLAQVLNDVGRQPAAGTREVDMVFVPESSPYWSALIASGKKESYLRTIGKTEGGIFGAWQAKSQLPAISPSTGAGAGAGE